jgi:isopenicillin-N epimerase
VRRDRQRGLRPLVVGHGASSPRTDRSRFRLEFDWTATADPTPFLCVPAAIRFMGSLLPGGWPELMARNHALALRGQKLLCEALGVAPPAPESMIGTLAAVPLPEVTSAPPSPGNDSWTNPLQAALLEKHRIEVPVTSFPAPPKRFVRITAQVYNTEAQFERLAKALGAELSRERAIRD